MMPDYYQRPPWWLTLIAILTVLPGLRLPWLFNSTSGENETLLYLDPLFTIFAAILAYRCYATDRKPMAWILLVLSVLSSVAIEFV